MQHSLISWFRPVLFFYVLSSFPFALTAQHKFDQLDFTQTDSIARTIRYKNDIYALTTALTAHYSQDIYKVRSIFRWITDNIDYDIKFINKGKTIKVPECGNHSNCAQLMMDWENDYISNVLRHGRGICDGYARVFKRMCDLANIKSEIITGYVKTKPYQIGIGLSVNHAWNAVLIDSVYYYLDPTWAAGYSIENEETGKLEKYVKDYEPYYWLTPFDKLKRNHYPESGRWVPEANYTKEKFSANPYYANDVLPDIELLSPATGMLTAKKGDTLHFRFIYTGAVKVMQVNSNLFRNPTVYAQKNTSKRNSDWEIDTVALRMQRYLTVKKMGDLYTFDYPVTDNSLYYLDILFDFRQVMRFKVKQPE